MACGCKVVGIACDALVNEFMNDFTIPKNRTATKQNIDMQTRLDSKCVLVIKKVGGR